MSFVLVSPSMLIMLKELSTASRSASRTKLVVGERGVGGEEAEHRRHVRVDHPGALGHAADRHRCARRRRAGSATAFGRVSVVMIARAASAPPSGESWIAAMPAPDLVHRQVDADHAGRGDEHLGRLDAELLAGQPGHLERVAHPALVGTGVRVPGVHDDRLTDPSWRCFWER